VKQADLTFIKYEHDGQIYAVLPHKEGAILCLPEPERSAWVEEVRQQFEGDTDGPEVMSYIYALEKAMADFLAVDNNTEDK
jgi:hypothetical protein